MNMLLLYIINTCVVLLVVTVHYEFLYHATRLIPKLSMKPRFRIVFGVGMALFAHTVEIWIFAIVYFLLILDGRWGGMEGNFTGTLMDCVYFSFTTFSTLGFGDIHPVGDIRYITGISSLTGIVPRLLLTTPPALSSPWCEPPSGTWR